MEPGSLRLSLARGEATVPLVVSDALVVRAIGAAFVRTPLMAEDLRAAKVVAFVLDRLCRPQMSVLDGDVIPLDVAHVGELTGMSRLRTEQAVTVLRQSGVLVDASENPGCVVFSGSVVRAEPVGYALSWPEILPVIAGQTATLLTLCACVDLLTVPWELTSLTYQALMLHTCYSLGMVQRWLTGLINAGIVERSLRTGRGHEYRFSTWSLGRGAAPVRRTDERVVTTPTVVAKPASATGAATASSTTSEASPMTVEIGGLVVRLPVGTEIEMTVSADGVPSYAIGPDLRIRRQS